MHNLASTHRTFLTGDVPSAVSHAATSRRLAVAWLAGIMVLVPVRFMDFPLNMDLVDFWSLVGMFLFWLAFAAGRQTVITHLAYAVAMLLIVVASALSMFSAPNPLNSAIVILKEVYLFVWFVTLTGILARLSARELRVVMWAWLAAAVAHGLLIIAQFVWPDLWRWTAGLAGKDVPYEYFRPSGLYISATARGGVNQAGFYQLLGFVPLVLARPPKPLAALLTVVLLASIVATGSMGTVAAFASGLMVATVAIVVLGKRIYPARSLAYLLAAAAFFGGFVLLFSGDHDHGAHLENIFVGRLERSSGGRFDLWQRGLDAVHQRGVFMLGVGPENFREMDWLDKQLHNDLLAFLVERGLLGAFGLILLGGVAVGRALCLLQVHRRFPARAESVVIVFLAATIAIIVASLTHQVFHFRELWLVIALQEAMLWAARDRAQAHLGTVSGT